MMNMMDRFAEGRGHQREIDMLLELTYVDPPSLSLCFPFSGLTCTSIPLANKLKAAQSAR